MLPQMREMWFDTGIRAHSSMIEFPSTELTSIKLGAKLIKFVTRRSSIIASLNLRKLEKSFWAKKSLAHPTKTYMLTN